MTDGKDSATRMADPVLIELDGEAGMESPADVPPISDTDEPTPSGQAMHVLMALGTRRSTFLGRWFWRVLAALLAFVVSIAAWEFVNGLLFRNPTLGYVALVLLGLFVVICFAILIREWAALARLGRLDSFHAAVSRAEADDDTEAARRLSRRLVALYGARSEMRWARDRVKERLDEAVDTDAVLSVAERELMAPLDAAARLEVEAAARQVATVTALVPLAFADVIAALTANVRMIRRIAEIYGGRSGVFGGWRLTRTVITHLVATGAVAIGDDLIGSIDGGGVLSKVSRRFGEGVINGALTARVGVAAMDVCRPLPFRTLGRPSVTSLVQRALTGLFAKSTEKDD